MPIQGPLPFKRFSRKTLYFMLWMSLLLFALGVFLFISLKMSQSSPPSLDSTLLLWAARHRTPVLNKIFLSITSLGSETLIVLFTAMGFFLFLLAKDGFSAVLLVMSPSGAGLCSLVLKHFYRRERPLFASPLVLENSFSYPSGHSLLAASFYLALGLLACRYFSSWRDRAVVVVLACVIVGMVGLSRIYLGVHFPTDVASGTILGAAWALGLTGILFMRKADKQA